MRKLIAVAATLLVLACEPPTEEDVKGAEDAGETDDAGDASASKGDASSDAGVRDASDADASTKPAADASADSSADAAQDSGSTDAAADAGVTDAAVPQSDSAVADSGLPAGRVLWSHREVTTSNLGAVPTSTYHQARFIVDLGGGQCSFHVDTPTYQTGWTGTSALPIDGAQRECLRNAYNCAALLKVQWTSCNTVGCAERSAGPVWETQRPACAAQSLAAGDLSLRVTIASLGGANLDETWELVTWQ